ncbi:MAG: TIGR03564 family F420-dependent LLM class oxidoreductase [Geodermatophilaceae bacterium]|nr:TIGR03564 family F420-dependent LLM class oxidoreductase [Geodermatophilaceae bacterium]
MRLGMSLIDPQPGPDPLGDLENQIRRAAEAGFSSAWLANIFALDALTALAVAGRNVPGIELGTAVVPTYPRHPAALAQQAITAHLALGERLVLGIGTSHKVVVEGAFGYSFDRPARHMRDYLSALVPLLVEGRVDVEGETITARYQATGPRPDRPPSVVLAALAPRMLELAGTYADGTILWMTGPVTIRDHIVPTIGAAAEAAGRPAPRIICTLPVCVTRDEGAARQRADKVFAMYGRLPSYRAMLDREGAAGPGAVAIIGDQDAVVQQIRGLAAVGVTDFVAAEFARGEEAEHTGEVLGELAGQLGASA